MSTQTTTSYDPLAVPRNSQVVEQIIATNRDEQSQIDAICEARGWWHIDRKLRDIINKYLYGNASTDQTVDRLATPIEETYTSADGGRAFWRAECAARSARQAFGPEDAEDVERLWGLPVHMCEPDPSIGDWMSTESRLWRLHFSILHAARKIPKSDEEGQMKLLRLVQALKARPEPSLPDGITSALQKDWVWNSGLVWSNLLLLGPSWAECRNCCPGGMAGYTVPERHAWENLLAFVRRLKDTGTADLCIPR